MALPDLTGQNIENTYNRVVQTDGTFFYDGTGSLLNLGGNIDTGSFATTGSNNFRGSQTISGSVRLLSGSQIRVDNATDGNYIRIQERGIYFSRNSGTSEAVSVTSPSDNQMSIYARTGVSLYGGGGGVQVMYINDENSSTNGSVLITGTNTAANSGSLHVRNSANTQVFRVFNGGSVAVGNIATPSATLDIQSTDTGSLRISGSGGSQITLVRPTAGLTGFIRYVGTTMELGTSGADPLNIYTGNTARISIDTTGNVGMGIGVTPSGARLTLRGSGATSATTTLIVQNSTPTNILTVLDNGTVGIGRTPTASLDIAGTTRMSGSFNTAASGSILTVQGSGSAQPIFTVLGSQGELFSITDSLSGSLFSVNDISGLPILEVFSDGTTLIGDYLDPMLITTKKSLLTNSGSFTIYSLPTASYDTAFFDYSVRSGSNARAGQIMAIQSGSSVNYTETTTTDFGTTTGLALGVFVSGSNMVLTGSAATTAWTVKTIIRSL
jgi:hypothetical protein